MTDLDWEIEGRVIAKEPEDLEITATVNALPPWSVAWILVSPSGGP